MFTDLNTLKRIRPVSDAIDNSDVNSEAFTDALNAWIHDAGSLGYEEAESLSLEISKKYTVDAAMQLLRDIKETRDISEDKVELRVVEKIPTGLIKRLSQEAGGSSDSLQCQGGTNICAFRGQEAIGYISAADFNNRFAVKGYYIAENHRKRGTGRSLLQQLLEISELKGFKGIGFDDASIQGQVSLNKFSKYLENQGNQDYTFSEEPDEDGSWAAFLFRKDSIKNITYPIPQDLHN